MKALTVISVLIAAAVQADTLYFHVDPAGSAAPPYASWETAATAIQPAVDLAAAALNPGVTDCVVLVNDGTYSLTSPITITNGITLRSVNGREATFINGGFPAFTNRCIEIRGVVAPAAATVDGFTISNGYAYLQPAGGGIFVTNSSAAIVNCTISRNLSATTVSGNGYGAGIGVIGATNIWIDNCIVAENSNSTVTLGYGAGIYMAGSRGLVSGCTIVSNVQSGNGGYGAGMYVYTLVPSNMVVSNCTFASNISNGTGGGGGYFYGSYITDCSFIGNVARSFGGGVYLQGNYNNVMTNSTVIGNRSGASGGGVTINRGSVYNSVIVSNASLTGGGYVSSEGVLRNCLIAANQASGDGGGVSWINKPSSYNMVNCTIVRNVAGGAGGGLLTAVPFSNVFINVICSDNRAAVSNNIAGLIATGMVYSCSPDLEAGLYGNVSADPVFADPGSGFGTNAVLGDYRILVGSPAVDSGRAAGATGYDLAGVARPLDGDGDGTPAYDMGAYEAGDATDGVFRCSFSAPTNTALDSLDAVFTAHAAGPNTNGLAYHWTFGDGTTSDWSSATRSIAHSFAYGSFTVSLTVSNELGQTAAYSRTAFINVYPSYVYVSANGANVPPYGSWATAATNIQAGIYQAAEGAGQTLAVLVGTGVWTVAQEILLTNAVTVRGAGASRTETVVRGAYPASTNRCFTVGHVNAVLENVTVTNGYLLGSANQGGGILVNAGTVRNCLVIGNSAYGGSTQGAGGGIYNAIGANVSNCDILNNSATWDGGGIFSNGQLADCLIAGNTTANNGGGLRTGAGTIDRCMIVNNTATGASSGGGGVAKANSGTATLRNCLVAGNWSKSVGGGIYQTYPSGFDVQNCTIVGNSATNGGGAYVQAGTHRGVNCIVAFNQATMPGGTNDVSGLVAPVFSNSCSPSLTAGVSGNVTGDPLFKKNGSGYGTNLVAGNYRLLVGSPAADTGLVQAWMASAVDLEGEPRIQGAGPNMGAYEKMLTPAGSLMLIR